MPTLDASFVVYGANIDELKENAFAEAVRFFRCHDDEITLLELHARPVVQTSEGAVTRWKANITMKQRSEDDDDAPD